jgi:hypothetical protein
VRLTTTQVSLIAAFIALAAPAVTYRANARLDRYRWVRERRAETYIDALAVLGRLAAYVSEPDRRPDPYDAIPVDILLALKGGDSNYATWKVGS